jgi:hypothetical protein
VIKLKRGLFEESDTIFLDKDGLVLEAASDASDDGELSNWSSVTVSFAGEQKKGLVCSAQGLRVVGIRFTMQNRRTQEASQPDQQISSCISIESGDACLTDCFVSNSSVSTLSFLLFTFYSPESLSETWRHTNIFQGIPCAQRMEPDVVSVHDLDPKEGSAHRIVEATAYTGQAIYVWNSSVVLKP